jgi:protein gp37
MLSDGHWRKPLLWNRDAERLGQPAKVFCASMADVFEDHPDVTEARKRLWGLIEATPWLRWQLLTKRPENVAQMVPWGDSWPSWVWLGVSAENQRWADARIPLLLDIPAAVRFISAEPLLGPVDLRFTEEVEGCNCAGGTPESNGQHEPHCGLEPGLSWGGLHWIIAGGESGAKARPMHPDWARSLRDQCQFARVPYLFKQWGAWGPSAPLNNDGAFDFSGAHALADDGTLYGPRDLEWPDGPRRGEAIRAHHDRAHLTNMYRLGKGKSGRDLDGRTWDEFPAEAVAA